MNSQTFHLKIINTKKTTYEGDILSILIPSRDGYVCFEKNHLPFVGQLKSGQIYLKIPNDLNNPSLTEPGLAEQKVQIKVESGFFHMNEMGCTVFVNDGD